MWAKYGNADLSLTVGNEDGFNPGDLTPYAERGSADFVVKMDVVVHYTSGNTVSAMTEAQALAYLKTLTLDVRFDTDGRTKQGSKALDPANIFHPIQSLPFDELRLMGLRTLELEVGGMTNSSTGLRRSYTAASSTIAFTMYVPAGQVTQIDEWQKIYGTGADMLAMMKLTVRALSDGLNAYDSDLTTDSITITVKGFRRKTDWERAGFGVMRREYQPGANKSRVETHADVLVLDATEETAKLSSTSLGTLTVEVGDSLVTDKETPAEIDRAYTSSPRVAAPENTISSYVTGVYLVDQQPLSGHRSGGLVATQETYSVEWDLRATMMPIASEQAVMQLVRGIVKAGLKPGQGYHFVNALAAAGITNVPGRLVPAGGLAYLPVDDPRAQKIPGLRAWKLDDRGGVEVRLYLPVDDLRKAAQGYRDAALERTQATPNGNTSKMDDAVNTLGYSVPAFCVDAVKGFPSSSKGGGAESGTYRTVKQQVVAAANLS